jgi:Uma2 family endonuclease
MEDLRGTIMSSVITPPENAHLVLHFGPVLNRITDKEFYEFCQLNKDWRFERTHEGDLIIMPPTGGKTGNRNFNLIGSFGNWVESNGTGKGFDSSTGFTLPNRATRSPDLAWVKLSRWNTLTDKEQEEFPPLCPDFVVELRSLSDSLDTLKAKMQEYLDNGAQLGWLIDPVEKKIYIYRPEETVECLNNPEVISGDPLLPGFILNVSKLWS